MLLFTAGLAADPTVLVSGYAFAASGTPVARIHSSLRKPVALRDERVGLTLDEVCQFLRSLF